MRTTGLALALLLGATLSRAASSVSVQAAATADSLPGHDTGSFVDPRDHHSYRTVKIGHQTWMAENLAFKTRNSWCYNGRPDACTALGRLYDWKAARKAWSRELRQKLQQPTPHLDSPFLCAAAASRFYRGRADLLPGIEALNASVTDAHNDREVIALIDRQLLAPIDQSAYNTVLRASRDTAIATALSPSAALDVVFVLWRNLKLVREVSTLYGAKPGRLGSWRLMRRMLANIAVAGVADGLGHVAVDALGGSLAAAISTKLGQGMVNGLLTARIGIATMVLCRPVAFSPDNRPRLGRIRTDLLSVPKEVL